MKVFTSLNMRKHQSPMSFGIVVDEVGEGVARLSEHCAAPSESFFGSTDRI